MKITKRFIKTLQILLLAALFAASFSVNAMHKTTPFSWYCKKSVDHSRPALDGDFAFINKYGGYYLGKDPNEKVIYLTFDAGYENGNVERIADVLAEKKAHAAFFLLDNFVARNEELTRRLANDGHLMCNHTKNHPDMTRIIDRKAFENQLLSLEDRYRDVTGRELEKIYRAPEGKFSLQNMEYLSDMGYKTVFWSFAYADWDNARQPDPEKALQKLKDGLHPGEILLLHPTSSTNAEILGRFIDHLYAEGYRIGSLTELFE